MSKDSTLLVYIIRSKLAYGTSEILKMFQKNIPTQYLKSFINCFLFNIFKFLGAEKKSYEEI